MPSTFRLVRRVSERPEECFRITAKEGDNYLADYSVTATPSAGLKLEQQHVVADPRGAEVRRDYVCGYRSG